MTESTVEPARDDSGNEGATGALSEVVFWNTFVALPIALYGAFASQFYIGPPADTWLPFLVENSLPSGLSGALTIGVAAILTQRAGVSGVDYPWVRRCAPFLVPAVFLGVLFVLGYGGSDFGYYFQLLLWPFASLAAGVAIEPIAVRLGRRLRSPAGAD